MWVLTVVKREPPRREHKMVSLQGSVDDLNHLYGGTYAYFQTRSSKIFQEAPFLDTARFLRIVVEEANGHGSVQ